MPQTKWWVRKPQPVKVQKPARETQTPEPSDTPKPDKKGDAMPADTKKVSGG